MSMPIPIVVSANLERRFWEAIDRREVDECWEWNRYRNSLGYGRIFDSASGSLYLSHRVSWTLTNGPIPEGLLVCHSCDNPPCCNPTHLFVGTAADNNRDKTQKGRDGGIVLELRDRTHCARGGHPLSGDNLYVSPRGLRTCRQCRTDWYHAKAREAGAVPMRERTHCPSGHEYAGDNLRIGKDGSRNCVTCRRTRDLARYHSRRAAGLPR